MFNFKFKKLETPHIPNSKESNEKIEKIFIDNENLKEDKLNHQENSVKGDKGGLIVELENLKKILAKVEKDLSDEFSEADSAGDKEISFLHEVDRQAFNDLKNDQEKLKKEIEKLELDISIIVNNQEN